MFAEPDRWPHYEDGTSVPRFQTYGLQHTTDSTNVTGLANLPLDVLLHIFPDLSLIDTVNTSAVCKSMRNLLTHEDTLTTIIRRMVFFGSLRWIKPCVKVKAEVEDAREALLTWVQDQEPPPPQDPLLLPDFLWIPFVHACLTKSDSMRNRKRLWNMAKQLEGFWNDDYADMRFNYPTNYSSETDHSSEEADSDSEDSSVD
ncbi:hypothetical protein DL96DRAFT_1631093 [Flagelloscypha sp. PMI_526]|nr:hypothetical protein DL96DRAFT_1631093 [Flagelloscypha sp. PMI_526]